MSASHPPTVPSANTLSVQPAVRPPAGWAGAAVSTGMAGITVGAVMVVRAFSASAVIFAGALASNFEIGLGAALISQVVIGGLLATFSAYRGTIATASPETSAALAVMMVAASAVLPSGPELGGLLLACCALAAGVFGAVLWMMGRMGWGNFIRFVPYPVIGGFLAGVGWVLTKSGALIVLPHPWSWEAVRAHAGTCALAVMLAAALVAAQRVYKKRMGVPVLLIAAVGLFHGWAFMYGHSEAALREAGLLIIGQGSGGSLWHHEGLFALFHVPPDAMWSILPQLGTLVLVGVVALLLTLSGVEVSTRTEIDLNRELQVTGSANILAGLGGGLPGFVSATSTTLARALAPVTRTVGWIATAVCVVALAGGSSVLSWMPSFVVSGVTLATGLGYLLDWVVGGWKRFAPLDLALVLIVLAVTVVFGLLPAVAAGIAGAVVLFIVSFSLVDVVTMQTDGSNLRSSVERSPSDRAWLGEQGKAIQVLRLHGFVFFGTATQLLARLRHIAVDIPEVRFLILDGRRVSGVDASAAYALMRLSQIAVERRVSILLTGFSTGVLKRLERGGLRLTEGSQLRRFDDLDRGLEWCEERLLVRERPPSADAASLSFMDGLRPALAFAEPFKMGAGEVLVKQGERSDEIYLVEDGLLTIRLEMKNGQTIRLRTLRAGTVIGEMAFYLGTLRSAAVITESPVHGYKLTRESLDRLAVQYPAAAARFHETLARQLAERLSEANRLMETAIL
ncbi:SulP family inorganic anion transporter [Rariglobus hedericola]|uniref:Cyclic nucleotide-binding domain-containing protein n=1 Tax=Rariglobus hedericola TaxID=2597822 RepID=A0A556QQ62_9BACT|nr:SulP family inorganic anion transporter [Rariglobus hedericola]TSJ78777.1 cyclic nucleotide-binding domain-containing protein [Rariglobus hedericola]